MSPERIQLLKSTHSFGTFTPTPCFVFQVPCSYFSCYVLSHVHLDHINRWAVFYALPSGITLILSSHYPRHIRWLPRRPTKAHLCLRANSHRPRVRIFRPSLAQPRIMERRRRCLQAALYHVRIAHTTYSILHVI